VGEELVAARVREIQRSHNWLNRPMVRCSDKASAIFANAAGSETPCKSSPCRSTVALLGEGNPCLAGLAGNIFVPIEHDLRRKRRMPAYFYSDVSPLRVQNMKRVVVDIGHRLLSLDVVVGADIPHRCLGSTDQDEEQSPSDGGLGPIVLGNVVLALSRRTVDEGNVARLGVTVASIPQCSIRQTRSGVQRTSGKHRRIRRK
jgi:hypothetical protein